MHLLDIANMIDIIIPSWYPDMIVSIIELCDESTRYMTSTGCDIAIKSTMQISRRCLYRHGRIPSPSESHHDRGCMITDEHTIRQECDISMQEFSMIK